MRLDLTSNIDWVITVSQRLHPQFQFTCAKALTDTVRLVQAAMPAHLERTLDRPTQFTKAGFFTQPARKGTLTAVVGVKDRQAQYLAYQVEGGTRAPSRQALRLPSVVDLNESGNLPAGLYKRIPLGPVREQLVPLVVMPKQPALRTPLRLPRRSAAHHRTRVRGAAGSRLAASLGYRPLKQRATGPVRNQLNPRRR